MSKFKCVLILGEIFQLFSHSKYVSNVEDVEGLVYRMPYFETGSVIPRMLSGAPGRHSYEKIRAFASIYLTI
ncbi:hypothetical protein Plhal304r1_c037g0113161 [Plasmopara halstedii]